MSPITRSSKFTGGRPDARPSTATAYRVHGMDCAEEVTLLKRQLAPVVGGEERLRFDVLNGKLIVDDGTPGAGPEEVIAAIERAGMRAERWNDEEPVRESGLWSGRRRTILTIASGVFGIGLPVLIIASIIGRGARFFLVAAIFWYLGPPARRFIERYFNLLTIAFTILLIGGFILIARYSNSHDAPAPAPATVPTPAP